MVLRFYGSLVLWFFGSVVLWFCGSVVLWFCGSVVLWFSVLMLHILRSTAGEAVGRVQTAVQEDEGAGSGFENTGKGKESPLNTGGDKREAIKYRYG